MNDDTLPPVPPAAPAPPIAPDFKDRSVGLRVFGVIEILCGGLAALMIPLMVLGQVMASRMTQEGTPLRQVVNGVFVYGVVAVALVWVGIGSYQARRWGRALSLVMSWSWLVTGVITMGFMVWFLPHMLSGPQQQGQGVPEMVQMMIKVVMLTVVGVIFVLVPGLLVWFFQSRHVKATCESRDTVQRWTDFYPLPLLALCLWLGFGALTVLLMPVSANGVLPVFGRLISGPAGWAGCVVLAGVLGYAAWAMYRLRPAGWWVAAATVCVGWTSGFVTLQRIDLMDMYRLMGYGERQIEMMKQYTFMQGSTMAYLSLGGGVVTLGYLLFVRRYFGRVDTEH